MNEIDEVTALMIPMTCTYNYFYQTVGWTIEILWWWAKKIKYKIIQCGMNARRGWMLNVTIEEEWVWFSCQGHGDGQKLPGKSK